MHGGFPGQEGTLDPDNTNSLVVAPLPRALRTPAPSVVLCALSASVVNTPTTADPNTPTQGRARPRKLPRPARNDRPADLAAPLRSSHRQATPAATTKQTPPPSASAVRTPTCSATHPAWSEPSGARPSTTKE